MVFTTTGAALTNYGTLTIDDDDTDNSVNLNVDGLLTNHGTITVDGNLNSDGVTSSAGSITVGGNVNAGNAALTNAADVSINITGSLTTGFDSSNSGTITANSFDGGGENFSNLTGATATLGVATNIDALTNAGTMSIKEGSGATTFNGSDGTLNLTTTSQVGSIGTLLAAGTSATVDADTSITVYASDNTLSQTGTQNDVILIQGTALTDTGFVAGDSVSSGSILLSLKNAEVSSHNIIADLEVLAAGDLLDESTTTDSTAGLADDFQDMDTTGEQVIETVYGSLVDNSASSAEMTEYLDEIRPDDSGSAAMAASDATTAAMGNIMNRGANLRGMSFGDMQAVKGMWVQALYSEAEQDARNGNLGYNSELLGFTMGVDHDMDDQTLGLAISYGDSHIEFNGRDQRDEVATYLASVYHFMRRGDMYLDSSLSLGGSTHKGRRLSGAAQMNSEYRSEQVGAQALAGLYMPRGKFMLEPMAALRMSMVKVDGYTASNGAGTLTEQVGSTNYHKVEAGVGGAVSTSWETDKGMMTPRASVMVYHDFVGDSMDNQVTFAGNDYTLKGATAEKTSYEAYLGVNMDSGENTTVNMGYTRVMKSGFSSDNFNLKLKYTF